MSNLAHSALHQLDMTISSDSIPLSSLEWNPDGYYVIKPDEEAKVAKECGIACGLCDEEGFAELDSFMQLGADGEGDFQRQR